MFEEENRRIAITKAKIIQIISATVQRPTEIVDALKLSQTMSKMAYRNSNRFSNSNDRQA
jgi:hypothetical protein